MQIKRAFRQTVRNLLAAAALAGTALILAPAPQAHAAVFVSVGIAPPAIPVYAQPLCPGDGYIWTPGYWAWGPDGYYWVDGSWVEPPYVGGLWTPGWWGFGGGAYFWHPGYWGRTVGYYGGINYGFGYFGTGFYGGYWNGGHFFYNRAYGHFGPGFHGNFYERRVSGFDGRPGGAAFNAHPPAQFAHGEGGFRSTVHGAEFHNNAAAANHGESFRGNEGYANRGNQGYANRGNQGFHANEGSANRPASGATQPRYNRQAPANNGAYRGGSAPAPHYSAPAAQGGSRSGGGGAHNGGGHGGGERR